MKDGMIDYANSLSHRSDNEPTAEPRGTFECPVCGKNTPHPHSQEDLVARIVQLKIYGKIADAQVAEIANLQKRISEFDTCIQRVATALGAVCGGVDGDQNDPNSTTQVLLKAIARYGAVLEGDIARNLAMMLRRIIWQINKLDGDSSLKILAGKADGLIKQYGLQGSPLRDAPPVTEQPSAGEPVAWYVYIPSQQNGYYVDSLDDAQLVDDLTNVADTEVTPLYTAPQPGVRGGMLRAAEICGKRADGWGSVIGNEYATGRKKEAELLATTITRAAEQINENDDRPLVSHDELVKLARGVKHSAPHAAQQTVSVPVGYLHVGGDFGGELYDWEFEAIQKACDALNEAAGVNKKRIPIFADVSREATSTKVIAWSCVNEVFDLGRCKDWCGNATKCVAKVENK